MKHKVLITLLLLVAILQSCSKEDVDDISNGKNKVVNKQVTGSSAKDILSDIKFKSMVIELVYVEGFEPTTTSIDNFLNIINTTSYKPEGITIEKRAIPSLGNTTYKIEDIADIEDANRTKYNDRNQIAIWLFFTDGESNKNDAKSTVLGTAYRNTSFVIFEESIHKYSNEPFEPSRTLLETAVINHEFGHILGLVNFGSIAQKSHEDEEHPGHCNIKNCLMYWESTSLANFSNMATMNSVPQLDSQCLADLRANGGK